MCPVTGARDILSQVCRVPVWLWPGGESELSGVHGLGLDERAQWAQLQAADVVT